MEQGLGQHQWHGAEVVCKLLNCCIGCRTAIGSQRGLLHQNLPPLLDQDAAVTTLGDGAEYLGQFGEVGAQCIGSAHLHADLQQTRGGEHSGTNGTVWTVAPAVPTATTLFWVELRQCMVLATVIVEGGGEWGNMTRGNEGVDSLFLGFTITVEYTVLIPEAGEIVVPLNPVFIVLTEVAYCHRCLCGNGCHCVCWLQCAGLKWFQSRLKCLSL